MRAAIFLCDLTGNMARPWAEAGYECCAWREGGNEGDVDAGWRRPRPDITPHEMNVPVDPLAPYRMLDIDAPACQRPARRRLNVTASNEPRDKDR